jgi:hypothetical protein
MMDAIKMGTILIQQGTVLPHSLLLESKPYSSGWAEITNVRSEFERGINLAGWTFFFLAGRIEATVFGFDKQRAASTAVDRIIANAKSRECNCLEITQVKTNSFLGVPYVRVSAHSRHIQRSSVFSS